MNAQEIINYIATAPKKTPVKIYVNLREPVDFASCGAKVFGEGLSLVVFGNWADLEPVVTANAAAIADIVIENDRRNSGVPLLDIRNIRARIEPGAVIREKVEIGEGAVIMMGAVINIGAVIGEGTMIDMGAVLGGRAMDIVHTPEALQRYMKEAVSVSNESPVLLDRFLDDAVEMDVDAVADGHEVQVAGVMEHIEQAGVHSGDSACSLPPYSLPAVVVEEIKRQTKLMAEALNVVGLMTVQFAVQHAHSENPVIYVLEVNPRASRTVPFVSKATGNPVAAIAARVMAGQTLAEQGVNLEVTPPYVSVKEAVFPFSKFLGVDPVLGPEMRSTGEVMGVGRDFGEALFKSQLAAGSRLPERGSVFISVRECDKPKAVVCAHQLHQAGFPLVATAGTAHVIQQAGIPCRTVGRIGDAAGDVIGMMEAGDITLVIMSVAEHEGELNDARAIRKLALAKQITYYTTMAGGLAASEGIRHMRSVQVYDLQGLHAGTLP